MLYEFLINPWVMMTVCAIFVFCEMFVAKKWFTSFTEDIKNEKARRGANLVLGLFTCIVLAYLQMYALIDVFGLTMIPHYALASAGIASFVYLALEKIFTESEVNALGKAFCNFVSHSELFDGELSSESAIAVARKLLNITTEIDKNEAEKEAKAVDKVVTKLNEFLQDGKITDAEKAEAEKLIAESGVDMTNDSTYAKFKTLLNK